MPYSPRRFVSALRTCQPVPQPQSRFTSTATWKRLSIFIDWIAPFLSALGHNPVKSIRATGNGPCPDKVQRPQIQNYPLVCSFKKTLPQDGNVLAQGVPLPLCNGVLNNATVVKPTSSPFRGLDLTKCYGISASLNATVRPAKSKASANDSAGSMNATVGSLKLSSRSFSQKSTKSGISAGCSETKFTISMHSGSNRYCSQRALTAHTLLGDIDMYDT
ncbi:hypothetical protein B0T10DRAFT_465865 [Thelonectria olida]|uniref:Uncharacterized protein n=1 Tax=Thelonectria olida TaxID=1576542 RepID=A0A9P8VT68_9HYPO|nr:hypothetical protein B0T10DRAFT_465865 [Thelonectria olida]